MKPKLTFLLALTFLFLFSGSSVVFADDLQDGFDAYDREDYKAAHKLLFPLAKQGNASAQNILGVIYNNGQGVPQDYVLAYMWLNICGSTGGEKNDEDCMKNRTIIEKKMTKQQIEKAQKMVKNWKPKK